MRKNFVFLLIFFSCQLAFAADRKDVFSDANLSSEQRGAMFNIRYEEEQVIMPYILELEAKEEGLLFLNSLECKTFDFKCKNLLKEDILNIEGEKEEALRRVKQKKSYYYVRYLNLLTKPQYRSLKKSFEYNKEIDALNAREALKEKKKKKHRFFKF